MAKRLPGFLYAYLNKITHVKDINAFLEKHHEKYGLDFVNAIVDDFDINLKIVGAENIPKNQRLVFVANHPLGGLDGITFIKAVSQFYEDVVFPVNDILMGVDNLSVFFIPINKHGSNANNVKLIEDTFAGEKTVLYFPAGLCSRKKKGEICDLEWKKTFVSKAKRHKRDIVPVFISGKNSNFFYNLSNFRKFFKIKANIEMLYLIDEVYKQKNKDIVITFGKPIPYTELDKSKNDREWAKVIKEKVYELGNNKVVIKKS
ncbi:MAG: glycerol acyltransferase [Bacteroidetes bacterium]|nr:MAG: glycerol acyltransferase [Bacteroidota bacterium]